MAVGHQISPFITIYKRSGDVFTKLPNPATLPVDLSYGVVFSADGVYMAVSHYSAPFITIYKRAGDVFTKLPDPASLPAGLGYSVAFSSDGVYMSVGHDVSPFITTYKRSGDVFTKAIDPAILPAGIGYGVAFYQSGASYMGNFIAVAQAYTPFISIYRDAYPFDPFTQFQVPLPAAVNGSTPVANITTAYPMAQLKPYIKARASL
jgi:hypothetical protein